MTRTAHLALVPRDGLFCKDARGWQTSQSGRGYGLDWPWPSTVLGALRTAWARAAEEKAGRLFRAGDWIERTRAIQLGRTLALRRSHGAAWRDEDTVWPVPVDGLWEENQRVKRLDPTPPDAPTLGRDDDDARESLWRPRLTDLKKPMTPPRWWRRTQFAAWLAGRSLTSGNRERALLPSRRVQAHVGIRPEEFTAQEGVLFSHDVVETLEQDAEWAIGAEVTFPDDECGRIATLGSDSRLAWVEPLDAALFQPPAEVLEAFRATSKGLRIVAVTPLCFAGGWLPDGLQARDGVYRGRIAGLEHEVILRAAFVPRTVHVSGWDMAAGVPKPTSRMVPPGAVYFFERVDGIGFGEGEARSLWLAAMGSRAEEGFGRVVPGVWRLGESEP